MAEPTRKAPEMESLIDSLNHSGRKRTESIRADICTWCGQPAIKFRNPLSAKEYTISGLCQKCQDDTFGED